MKKFFFLLLLLPVLSFRSTADIDVFFGDSITFGNELQSQQYTARWSTQYCNSLSREERNYAASGAAMTPGLNAGRPVFDINEVPGYQPVLDYIFISYWVNDYLYGGTPAAFAASTAAAVDGIKARGWPADRIVLCFNYLPESAPNWPYMTHAIAQEWLSALRGVQQAKGTSFLDFYTAVYNHPANATYSLDYIHPTVAWNGIMKQIARDKIESPLPLPAALLNFSGQRQGSTTVLKWTVAQEQNVATYDIERSENGSFWAKVGSVKSAGNATVQRSYNFTDNSGSTKKQLYRLNTVDINRSFKLSNIIVINGVKAGTLAVEGLFPNPAFAKLNVAVNSPAKDNLTVQIIDLAGRSVTTEQAVVEGGSNTLELNVGAVRAGSYFLKLTSLNSKTSTSSKFVKQ